MNKIIACICFRQGKIGEKKKQKLRNAHPLYKA